jgi:hypothetical protein
MLTKVSHVKQGRDECVPMIAVSLIDWAKTKPVPAVCGLQLSIVDKDPKGFSTMPDASAFAKWDIHHHARTQEHQ